MIEQKPKRSFLENGSFYCFNTIGFLKKIIGYPLR